IAVVKTASPNANPGAPTDSPRKTEPSSSTRNPLIAEPPFFRRIDRSFQTAARAKETGTLAKPACPLNGIASDASAARPEETSQAASRQALSAEGAAASSAGRNTTC